MSTAPDGVPVVETGAAGNDGPVSETTQDVTVVDVPDEERFEARTADGVAGFSVYQREPGLVIFLHTEVDEAYEGQGVGSALARGALDQVRAAGDQVLPLCPFIRAYIRRHPEYEDLVRRQS